MENMYHRPRHDVEMILESALRENMVKRTDALIVVQM